jgi:hypothetical protein
MLAIHNGKVLVSVVIVWILICLHMLVEYPVVDQSIGNNLLEGETEQSLLAPVKSANERSPALLPQQDGGNVP